MQKVFSEKSDLKLIKLVKENPVLYDYNDPKYMDFNAREVCWQKIGDTLEKPAADCKVRWINIRDVHRRILRKRIAPTRISKPAKAYKYDKPLDFMKNFYKEVVVADLEEESEDDDLDKASDTNTNSTWNDVVIDYDDRDSSNEGNSKQPKKRKKSNKSKKQPESFEEANVPASSLDEKEVLDVSDPIDAFLISIGATLKRFTPYHLNLVKSKIFHIVQEHDLQQIVERQPNRSDSIPVTESPIYFQG